MKAQVSSSIYMKDSDINLKKPFYSYEQHSADIIKWTLLKSPDFQSHASQITKNLLFMTLEVDIFY